MMMGLISWFCFVQERIACWYSMKNQSVPTNISVAIIIRRLPSHSCLRQQPRNDLHSFFNLSPSPRLIIIVSKNFILITREFLSAGYWWEWLCFSTGLWEGLEPGQNFSREQIVGANNIAWLICIWLERRLPACGNGLAALCCFTFEPINDTLWSSHHFKGITIAGRRFWATQKQVTARIHASCNTL